MAYARIRKNYNDTFTNICTHTYARNPTYPIHTRSHTCTHTHKYMHTYNTQHTHTYTHTHAHTLTHTRTHIHTYKHVLTRMQSHTQTHTHAQAHTLAPEQSKLIIKGTAPWNVMFECLIQSYMHDTPIQFHYLLTFIIVIESSLGRKANDCY